jgi:D-glycero-beta-D-manno-heptose-7-phosphate kinase
LIAIARSNVTPLPPSPDDLKRCQVLLAGDVMLDRYWFGSVDRISPEAPVPIVSVSHTEERLGGAANVARNMTSLGVAANLIAVVGDDEAARTLRRLLVESAIHGHLHTDADLRTTVKLRILGRRQQMLRADFESAPDREVLLQHLDRFRQLLPACDLVVLSDYGKGGLSHIGEMIAAATAAGKKILIDPKGDDYSRYAGATIVTPNLAELRAVVGRWRSEDDLSRRAQTLRADLRLEALLLTRSEEGMTLYTAAGQRSVPALAREVFDVSGAGDTVIATLAVMLAAGVELWEAVKVANRAGGIVVGKLGTATVSYEELFGIQS